MCLLFTYLLSAHPFPSQGSFMGRRGAGEAFVKGLLQPWSSLSKKAVKSETPRAALRPRECGEAARAGAWGTLQGAVLGCVGVHAYSHTGRGQGHDVQGTLESVCLCPAPFGDLHSEPLGSRSGGDLPGDGGKAGKETQLKVV